MATYSDVPITGHFVNLRDYPTTGELVLQIGNGTAVPLPIGPPGPTISSIAQSAGRFVFNLQDGTSIDGGALSIGPPGPTGPTGLPGSSGTNLYAALARIPDGLIAGTVIRDANEAATSAPVVWPDGTAGTYTADTVSTAFPGAVDAYHITYGSPTVLKTYTQPLITRDATGAAITVPAIVVT
jgi:hypothetical protein